MSAQISKPQTGRCLAAEKRTRPAPKRQRLQPPATGKEAKDRTLTADTSDEGKDADGVLVELVGQHGVDWITIEAAIRKDELPRESARNALRKRWERICKERPDGQPRSESLAPAASWSPNMHERLRELLIGTGGDMQAVGVVASHPSQGSHGLGNATLAQLEAQLEVLAREAPSLLLLRRGADGVLVEMVSRHGLGSDQLWEAIRNDAILLAAFGRRNCEEQIKARWRTAVYAWNNKEPHPTQRHDDHAVDWTPHMNSQMARLVLCIADNWKAGAYLCNTAWADQTDHSAQWPHSAQWGVLHGLSPADLETHWKQLLQDEPDRFLPVMLQALVRMGAHRKARNLTEQLLAIFLGRLIKHQRFEGYTIKVQREFPVDIFGTERRYDFRLIFTCVETGKSWVVYLELDGFFHFYIFIDGRNNRHAFKGDLDKELRAIADGVHLVRLLQPDVISEYANGQWREWLVDTLLACQATTPRVRTQERVPYTCDEASSYVYLRKHVFSQVECPLPGASSSLQDAQEVWPTHTGNLCAEDARLMLARVQEVEVLTDAEIDIEDVTYAKTGEEVEAAVLKMQTELYHKNGCPREHVLIALDAEWVNFRVRCESRKHVEFANKMGVEEPVRLLQIAPRSPPHPTLPLPHLPPPRPPPHPQPPTPCPPQVCLLQIGYRNLNGKVKALLLHLEGLYELPAALVAFFKGAPGMRILGCNVMGDVTRLFRQYMPGSCEPADPSKSLNAGEIEAVYDSLYELNDECKARTGIGGGLASMAQLVLKTELRKPKELRQGNWMYDLGDDMQKYAALDVAICFPLYDALERLPQLHRRLGADAAFVGKSVRIQPFACKNRRPLEKSCSAMRAKVSTAATGTICAWAGARDCTGCSEAAISTTHRVVEISQVFAQDFALFLATLPGNQQLPALGELIAPFKVVLPLGCLGEAPPVAEPAPLFSPAIIEEMKLHETRQRSYRHAQKANAAVLEAHVGEGSASNSDQSSTAPPRARKRSRSAAAAPGSATAATATVKRSVDPIVAEKAEKAVTAVVAALREKGCAPSESHKREIAKWATFAAQSAFDSK